MLSGPLSSCEDGGALDAAVESFKLMGDVGLCTLLWRLSSLWVMWVSAHVARVNEIMRAGG